MKVVWSGGDSTTESLTAWHHAGGFDGTLFEVLHGVFQVEALNGLMGTTGGGEARPTETLAAASLLRAMDSLRASGYARASDWTPMGLPQHFRYGGVWSPPPL